MTADVTTTLDADVLDAIDAWIEAQPEPKPTRGEAVAKILKAALMPLALSVEGEQFELADRWQVGQAQIRAKQRPFLALQSAAGSNLMLILDDVMALELAQEIAKEVSEPAGQPSSRRH